MQTAALTPITEYLTTSYRPDRDYVDGAIVERYVGEWDHSWMQALLFEQLLRYKAILGLLVVTEQRVQVRPSRFRVPDLCVVHGKPGEQILTRPPLLVIEILSPRDSMSSMQERIDDYLDFGIENVWIFDPRRKKAYWADSSGVHEAAREIKTEDAAVAVELESLWLELAPSNEAQSG